MIGHYKQPSDLLRLLHRAGIIGFFLVIGLSAIGIQYSYESYVINRAGADAVSISQLLVKQPDYRNHDHGADLAWVQNLNQQQQHQLDSMLRSFLAPFGILKIKIFAKDGTTVYSSTPEDIGHRATDNQSLNNSLNGQLQSSTQSKHQIHDLTLKSLAHVDVVETYVPVRNTDGEIVGSFELYKDMSRYREEIQAGVMSSVKIMACIVIGLFLLAYLLLRFAVKQLSETQKKLHFLAIMDGLTHTFNRREIMNRAEKLFDLCKADHRAGKQPISVLMLDIDHFKVINDCFGHPVGDYVLKSIATDLKTWLGQQYPLGRYGGEEFMIILPETDQAEAVQLATEICTHCRQMTFSDQGPDQITVSIGVASCQKDDQMFDQLLLRADHALYKAKENGRDRVETVAESPKPTVVHS